MHREHIHKGLLNHLRDGGILFWKEMYTHARTTRAHPIFIVHIAIPRVTTQTLDFFLHKNFLWGYATLFNFGDPFMCGKVKERISPPASTTTTTKAQSICTQSTMTSEDRTTMKETFFSSRFFLGKCRTPSFLDISSAA